MYFQVNNKDYKNLYIFSTATWPFISCTPRWPIFSVAHVHKVNHYIESGSYVPCFLPANRASCRNNFKNTENLNHFSKSLCLWNKLDFVRYSLYQNMSETLRCVSNVFKRLGFWNSGTLFFENYEALKSWNSEN